MAESVTEKERLGACRRGMDAILHPSVMAEESDVLTLYVLIFSANLLHGTDLLHRIRTRAQEILAWRLKDMAEGGARARAPGRRSGLQGLAAGFVARQLGLEAAARMPGVEVEETELSSSSSSLSDGALCRALMRARLTCDAELLHGLATRVRAMHPYPGPGEGAAGADWGTYVQRLLVACTWVDVLSDLGRLRLQPAAFPHEFCHLRSSLAVHMQQRDVYMVSRIMEGLRAFGVRDDDSEVRGGRRLLLALQGEDGGWRGNGAGSGRRVGVGMGGVCCATSAAAIRALAPLPFRGHGPWMQAPKAFHSRALATPESEKECETLTKRLKHRTEIAARRHSNEVAGMAKAVAVRGAARVGKLTWALPDGRLDRRLETLKKAMRRVGSHIQAVGAAERAERERATSDVAATSDTVHGMRTNLVVLTRALKMTGVLVRAAAQNGTVGPALAALSANMLTYRARLLGRSWRTAAEVESEADGLFVTLDRVLGDAGQLAVTELDLRAMPQLGRSLAALRKDVYSPPSLQDAAASCIRDWTRSMAAAATDAAPRG